jgi:hypothetical protein
MGFNGGEGGKDVALSKPTQGGEGVIDNNKHPPFCNDEPKEKA